MISFRFCCRRSCECTFSAIGWMRLWSGVWCHCCWQCPVYHLRLFARLQDKPPPQKPTFHFSITTDFSLTRLSGCYCCWLTLLFFSFSFFLFCFRFFNFIRVCPIIFETSVSTVYFGTCISIVAELGNVSPPPRLSAPCTHLRAMRRQTQWV